MSWASTFLPIIAAFLIILTCYYKWAFLYWQRKNIPFLPPQIPFGNTYRPITGKENWAITIKHLYHQMKTKGWKHGGFYVFTSPNYLPVDLDFIKNITTNDFNHFTDRGTYYNKNNDFEGNLFFVGGSHWKRLRPKLTPTFTSSKIKTIFKHLEERQKDLFEKIEEESLKNVAIDVKDVSFCFTLDIIGSWAFGIRLNSFREKVTPFKIITTKMTKVTVLQRLFWTFITNFSGFAQLIKVDAIQRDIREFFISTVREVIESRKKSRGSHNDFLQLLLDMKESFLSIEEIAAQCFVFVMAGFETSSSLMTFALYELARNPEIQDRVRREIDEVLEKHQGKICYDSIQDMKYLNQVVDESLRMYPPLPLINRKCVKDYKIPGENVVLKNGTIVVIPIMGIHYDQEYYPDPETFDPERFNEENKSLRHKYAFIPFGAGPRTCIGMQMGLIQAKMGISCLIRNFNFSVDSKTAIPVEMQPNNITWNAIGGVWLKATKIIQK